MKYTKKLNYFSFKNQTVILGKPFQNCFVPHGMSQKSLRRISLFFLFAFLFTVTITISAYSETTKIMPLGDSITFDNYTGDTRIQELRTSYRQPLWIDLIDAGYNVDFVGGVKAGQNAIPPFDADNEGHPGWSDAEIAAEIYNFLYENTPDIVLLHIGTNDLDSSPDDVETILNEIDLFENDYSTPITVILSLIINRNIYSSLTAQFNDNIHTMAQNRIDNGDDIVIVDMEHEAGIDYRLYPTGDMIDNLHPADRGYEKMANTWFVALGDLLPAPEYYPPEIITEPALAANIGLRYRYNLFAKGNPLPDYYVQSGPPGMDIDLTSGELTWEPVDIGEFTIVVEARNTQGTDFQTFTVDVDLIDKLWLEGESGEVMAPMEVGQAAGASSAGFVWSRSGSDGYVEYLFEAPEPGNYTIWGRIIGASSGSDSFFVSMDNSGEQIWDLARTSTWLWDRVSARGGSDPTIFYLEAGYHTFRIAQRETGARLDRLLITSDSEYVPTGLGETEGDFFLNISVSGSGSVAKDPGLSRYADGQAVTLTATPSAGWQFDGWEGDLSDSENPVTITMDGNINVTAHFSISGSPPDPQANNLWLEAESGDIAEPMEEDQDAAASAGGFIWSQYGSGGYVEVGFEVTEPGDYVIWGRVIAAGSGSNSFFASMDSDPVEIWDLQISAAWVWDRMSARGGSDPSVFYLDAGYHTLTIGQRETGARVDRILVTSDTTYVPSGLGETDSYLNLNVSISGNGSVTKDPDLSGYTEGQEVMLTAEPSPGWQFEGWSGDLIGNENPASIVVNSDKDITALFLPIAVEQYQLILNSSGSGSVAATPAAGPYGEGTVVQLMAIPSDGWQFDGWSGDLMGNENPVAIVMDGDKSITAMFRFIGSSSELIWIEAESGMIVVPMEEGQDAAASAGGFIRSQYGSGGYVEFGFDVTEPGDYVIWGRVIAVGRSSNSFFTSVDSDPEAIWDLPINSVWVWDRVSARGGSDPSVVYLDAGYHTLRIAQRETGARVDRILVTSDMTYVPLGLGETDSYLNLNVRISGNGSVTKDPDLAGYTEGQEVMLTAEPSPGWQFEGWSGDLAGNANPAFIVMDEDKSITAMFSFIGSSSELIWIEAESGMIVVPMEEGQDAAASAGGFIRSQYGSGGYVEFGFDVTEPGDYVIWGRVIAASSGKNSFFASMDSGSSEIWDLPVTSTWVWDRVSARGGSNPSVFYLDEGYHTLRIAQRETGARLDRLLITSDMDYQP